MLALRSLAVQVEELFNMTKKTREAQQKIDVLSDRLRLVESKAGSSDELKAALDKYKKELSDRQVWSSLRAEPGCAV